MTLKQSFTILALVGVGIFFASIFVEIQHAHAANTNQSPTTVATSSARILTTAPSFVFATSSCTTRVISTTGSAINISFGATAQPSMGAGILQGASTTVVYDASQYGCGAVYVYSLSAATTSWLESR